MKFLPLVWAALWRKPARLILTFLSVTMAFILFGLMVGLNASYAHIIEMSRMDRVYVGARFGGTLPLAARDQIARLPGVTHIGVLGGLFGYYRDPKNGVLPVMLDSAMQQVWTEVPLTPAQWRQLQTTPAGVFVSRRIAARYNLKAGDALPLLTVRSIRQDGSKLWPFTVLGVIDDLPTAQAGLTLGNYDYFDHARLAAMQGTALQFQLLVADPNQAAATAKTIDAMFANSAGPTRSIPERTLSESNSRAGLDIPFVTEAVAGAGLFMILFLTGNGIAQSVRERVPEFAVLKTLGFSDAGLAVLVFVEAAIPCLFGAAIGLVLATAINDRLPHLVPANLPLPIPLPYLTANVLALAFVFAVLVAFASAVLPALRVRRLDIATALAGR
jgi:putative ABC transport system permease protein